MLEKLYALGAVNRHRKSILLLGPPGCGKSTSVYEFAERTAKKLGKEFVDYNDDIALELLKEPERYFVLCDFTLTEAEPADLLGIPREITEDAISYKPLLWARVMSKCAGVLFLDELTNVQRPDIISVSYRILHDRKIGFIKLHKDVLVVAAGNSPDESAIGRKLTDVRIW